MNNYSKNLILYGEIDYHCLLCEETFKNEAEVERHVRWENHRKQLKNMSYLPKFKGDFIFKINNYHFCEVCNVVLSTTIKTSLHIKGEDHLQRKNSNSESTSGPHSNLVKRESDSIVIFNSITLTERDWHGIIDNQCLLCDGDVDDVEKHMKLPSHVINLIQTKTESQDGDKLFRKTGSDIFYCFTCKEPFGRSAIDAHWISKEHIDNKNKYHAKVTSGTVPSTSFYDEFKNNMKKMFTSSDKKAQPNNDSSEVADKVQEFQKENIDINFEKNKVVCNKCSFSPAFTVKAFTDHIKMHKKAETKGSDFEHPTSDSDEDAWITDDDSDNADSSEEDEEETNEATEEMDEEKENLVFNSNDSGKKRAVLSDFGKKHYIKLVNAGSKGYCELCHSYISAHINNFRQHIKGAKHIGHLELKGLKKSSTKKNGSSKAEKPYITKTLKQYLRNIYFVKQMDDFWINRDLCVDKHSFVGVCHMENNGKYDKIKCFLCNDVFPSDKDQAHCETLEHQEKLFATKVITSLKGEFVRELRPSLFHCGFCNEVAPSYVLMKKHLKSYKHCERREQQDMVAGVTHDQFGMYMADTKTADTDIMWMRLMGHRLF